MPVTQDDINGIYTDFSEGRSRYLGTQLEHDHLIIKAALLQALGGVAGGRSGPGRYVTVNYATGRATAAPGDLYLRVYNGDYRINGVVVTVNEVLGYALIPVPPNMADGKRGYLTATEAGSVTILPENWHDGNVWEELDLPCVGFVTSDGVAVTAIDYKWADELPRDNDAFTLYRQLADRVTTLEGGITGGGGGGGGGGGPVDAYHLRWDATDGTDPAVMTADKVLDLIAALKAYVDGNTSRSMQMPDDYLVEAIIRVAVGVIEVNPRAGERIQVALAHFGFYGHSLSGLFADPGIGDTPNFIKFTTLTIDTPNRRATP